ncbi:septal ring lytic transglycosylase RlpA family protein [Limobrevibacterium gyesilva]|uniref:Endolytic peptidoglycan transglycosylase RlpA n=1 Tax=Limobrevibacterium gyesilva TaxID=2991712 RepID=A0AA42CGF4_9PROT|nr:septal ring lytic transglycosylase RlpA family protein [Limobrevibacterium gyesilva]MCW3477664.1 septal ring lytic transglycosylase RlpA family protein [Limobrevibacterium gyesilva]
MISRARRVFPGMVVSMMLVGPAMAATTGTPTAGPETQATRRALPATDSRKPATPHRNAARRGPATTIVAHTASADATPIDTPATDGFAGIGPVWNDQTGQSTWSQTGIASWYGGARWHGRRTSSGARYDQNALTAAHATLPIGTKVRVTLEGSGRSVIVTINDRPGTRRRIIDLSRSAAAELGILSRGVAVVTLSAL